MARKLWKIVPHQMIDAARVAGVGGTGVAGRSDTTAATAGRLHGRRFATPWRICGASAALTLAGLVFYVENRRVPGTAHFFDPVMPAIALAFPVMGAFIASRRPGNPIGWLWLSSSLVAVAFLTEQYAVHALVVDQGTLPAGTWMAWLATFVWVPGYLALWTVVPLLFPDGRLPSPRWAPVLWGALAVIAVATAAAALAPPGIGSPATSNPLGVDGFADVADVAGPAQALAVLGLGPVCLGALVGRYRRATGPSSAQLEWVVVAASLAVLVPLSAAGAALAGVAVPLGAYRVAGLVALVAVPAAAAAAVVRHRLLDIDADVDSAVNTLVGYAALATVGVVAYVSILTVIEMVGSGRVGLGPSLMAVAGAGALAYGLRKPLQRRVDRLLYRKREYDYRLLTSLGESVQSSVGPDAVLPAIVATIASGLRLRHVAIDVGEGDEVVASAEYGQAADDVVVVPLVHQNRVVGRLRVAPRSPNETFDAADRRLIEDVARQVGIAAYALCLTADLQRSRERLVTAREEERRRLRRDLHDGLKPALAGVSLGLEAVRNTLGADSPTDELLARLKAELDSAAADIRRLVYDLRPPALDELGLAGALHQHANRFALDPHGVQVVVDVPGEVNGLPAAVEVAAYRIAIEALENVRRHAGAGLCHMVLAVRGDFLELEVSDDGKGPQQREAGVGLVAMRERAAELGGACTVEAREPTGTSVRATLPIGRR